MTAYIIIFIILALAEVCYLRIAARLGIADKPNSRSSHSHATIRGGGVVFYCGALAFFIWSGFRYPMFMSGLTLLAVISFIDDMRGLPVWPRLLTQIVAVAAMCADIDTGGMQPWLFAAVVFIGVAFLNAYNFMDGINGSAGLYALVTLTTLAVLNGSIHFIDPKLLWCSLMAAVIFCYFNVRLNARCFAGDVGSLSTGFILLFAISALIAATSRWGWAVLAAVYGVDASLTIIRRIANGQNVFRAHRMHCYQILCNELGFPHLRVASAYAGTQLVIDMGALFLRDYLEVYFAGVTAALCIAYFIILKNARPTEGNGR